MASRSSGDVTTEQTSHGPPARDHQIGGVNLRCGRESDRVTKEGNHDLDTFILLPLTPTPCRLVTSYRPSLSPWGGIRGPARSPYSRGPCPYSISYGVHVTELHAFLLEVRTTRLKLMVNTGVLSRCCNSRYESVLRMGRTHFLYLFFRYPRRRE
jgi:hypothetical protein